jgi:hypothetical protein
MTEKKAKEASEGVVTMEEFIAKAKINPGLVASFKVEAAKTSEGLSPRSAEDWVKAFEAQSKKVYK